jgi:hypothetical protein
LECGGCEALVALPASMRNLERLACEGCAALAALPGGLARLEFLWCVNCPNITRFPPVLGKLRPFASDHRLSLEDRARHDARVRSTAALVCACEARRFPAALALLVNECM